jgi:uncharacterized membrane protein (UPF0127 family)
LLLAGTVSCTGGGNPESRSASSSSTPPGRVLEYTRDLRFLNEDGSVISEIRVAVVDTDEKRNMGLMDVRDMPENRGMLFVFDQEAPLTFWMANTPLSLDIIYVNALKQIVTIHTNTPPLSEKNFDSSSDAMYAIEVNAGYCLKYDIREGLKVDF